ncbi:MAG TPA: acyl-CoA dehydrogenase [Burkholderiales bacterium]|jgi:acyl-CoA dehydrogenase|nr:acyl-CoA dehydrogenase [Burkholderiales bacterium]
MSEYKAPLRDMHFVLQELAGLAEVAKLPGLEEINAELVDQILEESAKFASGVLSPLNKPADKEGSKWDKGKVTTPKGFKEAYRQFVEAGWNALQAPAEHGGQGLPKIVSTPVVEMWKSANLSFSLVTMLTAGAVEALILRGTEEQKKQYLPKMIEGSWTGTMNLTEPQAGSDLALVRTKAVREGDHYRVSGQKIFITYGEHDLAENIVHLVLGRVEGAPEGVRGISLFLVPKFLVSADGSLGQRNEVQCASIEHKLGIHASPTAVLVYENAVGYLVGEENHGLEYMFIMMNLARFAVGMEGLAISERAYQQALAYAKERVQSRDVAGGGKAVTIIHHPDVRRMLMSMKSQTEAMRALGYVVAAAVDKSLRHPDKEERARNQAFVDLMIPIVKGWFTETGIDVASTGIQVHGGMGFIEETGAAQHLRDARITTIYEGTTGIQANDLIGRKIAREGGATAKGVIAVMRAVEAELGKAAGEDMAATREAFSAALTAAEECVSWMVITYGNDIKAAHAGAVPFLKLMGIVCGGWQMARAALVARQRLSEGKGDKSFYEAKIKTARFYADHVLTQAPGLRNAIVHGAAGVMALAEDQF